MAPTLEEYSYILKVGIKDRVPFININELSKFHLIVEALHLEKKEVEVNLKLKGGVHGFTLKFLVDKAITFVDVRSWNGFNTILALLIYGIVLFHNMEYFMDLASIHIFMYGNYSYSAGRYLPLYSREESKEEGNYCVLCSFTI